MDLSAIVAGLRSHRPNEHLDQLVAGRNVDWSQPAVGPAGSRPCAFCQLAVDPYAAVKPVDCGRCVVHDACASYLMRRSGWTELRGPRPWTGVYGRCGKRAAPVAPRDPAQDAARHGRPYPAQVAGTALGRLLDSL